MRRKSRKQKQTEKQEIENFTNFLNGCSRAANFFVFCLYVLSGWLTTKGLFDATIEAHAANTEGMITAMMTAIAAAIIIGGGTILLSGLAMHAQAKQRGRVIALTLALIPLIFCVSTYNAILATTAHRSIIYDMRDTEVEWKQYVAGNFQNTAKAKNALSSLLPVQASICDMAEHEVKNGLVTGSSGRGAVSAAYASACSSISEIIKTLEETSERTENRREVASNAIKKMQSIPRDTSITVFERQLQFKEQDSLLRELIELTSSERVVKQVSSQLKNMRSLVVTLGAQNGTFGEKQSNAVSNLGASLETISHTLNEFLGGENAGIEAMPAELLSMDEATFKYLSRNLPNVMIAVAVDTFPLWLIIFLLTAKGMLARRIEELNNN